MHSFIYHASQISFFVLCSWILIDIIRFKMHHSGGLAPRSLPPLPEPDQGWGIFTTAMTSLPPLPTADRRIAA